MTVLPTVIKLGGHALDGLGTFARAVVAASEAGLAPVVVHGGGPQIDAMLVRLSVPSAGRRGGLRVTTAEMIDVVTMVLLGQVGPAIVTAINHAGGSAVALSGADGKMLTATPRDPELGLVGDVTDVRTNVIDALLNAGQIPVIAPVAPDAAGIAHNVNADAVAAAIAVAVRADKLVMLTDVPGLYERWPDPDSLISHIGAADLELLLPDLSTGMIPKMAACLAAVRSGVTSAHVLDGRDESWVGAITGALVSGGTTVSAAKTTNAAAVMA